VVHPNSKFVKSYEAWILYFSKSIGTGYRYVYSIFWVCIYSIPILFYIFFVTNTRVVLLWYAHGTSVVYESKNMQFFSFFFYSFFFYLYKDLCFLFVHNIKVAALLINNNKVVAGLFAHSAKKNRLNLVLFKQIFICS
jgi:hypothetical protein